MASIFDISLFSRPNKDKALFVPDKMQSSRMASEKRGVGVSEVELAFLDAYGAYAETGTSNSADIQTIIHLRLMRKLRYREMSLYHMISQMLDASANDAVAMDKDGNVITPEIADEVPQNIRDKMVANANRLWYSTCDLTNNAWELYRKWLVEGEQAIEWVNGDKVKGIKSMRVLPSATIIPRYDGAQIIGYLQYPITFNNQNYVANDPVTFELNQVGYSNYGVFGNSPLDVLGYLEGMIRPYNQLKGVEDSLLVYRISRAPERRVWNVDVGMMSRGRVSEYIQKLIQKFRRRMHYNPSTGEIDSHQQMMSVMDDIWLPKQDGKGTTIETTGGNIEISKIDDVLLFVRNLYRAGKYPKSRWSDDQSGEAYGLMKADNVNPEEVNWSRFNNRCRAKWGQIWLQGWMQENRLSLTPQEQKWNTTEYLSVRFVEDNLYELNKSLEFNETRMNALATAQGFLKTADNPDGLFAREFVLKKFFMMTDEEWELNEKLMVEEAKKAKAEADANEEDGMGDEDGDINEMGNNPDADFAVGDDEEVSL